MAEQERNRQMDSMDEVVETLRLEQVRTLAARKLRGYRMQLQEELRQVAYTKQTGCTENTIKLWIENYERTRHSMQEFGIWQPEYDSLLAIARETGEFDHDRFNQIEDSFRVSSR